MTIDEQSAEMDAIHDCWLTLNKLSHASRSRAILWLQAWANNDLEHSQRMNFLTQVESYGKEN